MCELCGPQLGGPALRLEVYDEELCPSLEARAKTNPTFPPEDA